MPERYDTRISTSSPARIASSRSKPRLRPALEHTPLVASVVYTIVGVLPLYLTSAQAVILQRDLGFGPTEFGLVVSSFFLVSSIASKRAGPRVDRTGATRGLRIATSLTVMVCLLIAVAVHRWETLAVLLGLAGLANAYGQVSANLVIAQRVRSGRQGLAFSAKQSAIPSAALLSGLVVPFVGGGGSWRWSFVVVAATSAVLFLSCPRFKAAPTAHQGRRGRATTPALLALMVAAAIAGGIGNSFAAFTTDAAVSAGFTPGIAGVLLTGGSCAAIVMRLGAGLSVDRHRGTGALETSVMFALGALGLGLLSITVGSRSGFVIGLILTFAGAWGWQGVIAYLSLRTIDLPAATTTGAVWSGVYFGTVIVPALVGAAAERWPYPVVFAGMGALMLLALISLGLSRLLSQAGRMSVRHGPQEAG